MHDNGGLNFAMRALSIKAHGPNTRLSCFLLQVVARAALSAWVGAVPSAARCGSFHDTDQAALAEGKMLAKKYCSVCHAVELGDESPTDINRNTAFWLLYRRYPIDMLVEAGKTGRLSGHDEMPGFDFSTFEIHALLTYIDSLSPKSARYLP